MKKNLFMVAAVALMAMVSCNKIENNNGGEEVVVPTIPFEFTAYASEKSVPSPETQQPAMAQKVDTKATLVYDENGKNPKTHWKSTDKINVNGFEFTVDPESEFGAGARFVGKVDENFGTEYKAVYPSSAGKTWDAITVKSNQTAQADTFDPDALVAVAYSNTDNVLAFKHVTSLLKFQVPAACQTVTISSDDALTGTIKITKVVNDDPSTQNENESNVEYEVTDPQNTLTVTCEGGFKADTYYYVAVLPDVKNNFVVRIDGYLSTNKDKVTIKRSTIANMKTLPAAVASTKYGIASTFQTNEWTPSEAIVMYEDLNDNVILKGVQLYKDDMFNVVENKTWDVSYGVNGGNVTVVENGIFDISFNKTSKKITATCVEKITDIEVEVTVVVDRPWSAVYSYLWDKGTSEAIGTKWPGDKLGTAKGTYTYKVDGEYIGQNIGYKLHQYNDSFDNTGDQSFTLQSRKENKLTVSAYDLYLKPCSNWKQANAWFAIYCWNSSGNAWNGMIKITNDIYGVNLPTNYSKGCDMKFVRMDPNKHELSWDSKWDESSNTKSPLATSAKVCYTLNNGWTNVGGTWGSL